MKIAIAQINPKIGDFHGNAQKILEAYRRACQAQARLLLTPEMSICGYPPHDLVERPEIFERCQAVLEQLRTATLGQSCALAVGSVDRNPEVQGRAAQNVAWILENGQAVLRQAKTLLPTYDVFDETRYFEPAHEVQVWDAGGGFRVAMAVCEDLWGKDPARDRLLYQKDPVESYRREKVQLVASLSASPYEWEKSRRREALHSEVARSLGAALVYVNQVGANDEILFDGGSFACDSSGRRLGRLDFFREGFAVVDLESKEWKVLGQNLVAEDEPQEIELVYRGLVLGIQDYFKKTGFKSAIMGLSGGIDSAVIAVLAAHALGRENLLGIAMPSQYSSSHSLEDAEQLARNLGIEFQVRPIKFLFSTSGREIGGTLDSLAPVAQENLQSRLRGLILMTLSNHRNALVLTTGNKSEIAMGYCTLYGDMAGALAPIGDLYKIRVYELARWINEHFWGVIPERSLSKAPSAELRPGQTDQDSLPPYEQLDPVLEAYLEKAVPIQVLQSQYGTWVTDILRRIEMNEYKRRQAAPVLKITQKAFGIGRRIPIAKTWEQR